MLDSACPASLSIILYLHKLLNEQERQTVHSSDKKHNCRVEIRTGNIECKTRATVENIYGSCLWGHHN